MKENRHAFEFFLTPALSHEQTMSKFLKEEDQGCFSLHPLDSFKAVDYIFIKPRCSWRFLSQNIFGFFGNLDMPVWVLYRQSREPGYEGICSPTVDIVILYYSCPSGIDPQR